MGVSVYTHKILWGRSAGKCAICKRELVEDPLHALDDASIIGDEAHIVAKSEAFVRGDYDAMSAEERDSYSNLVLLCKVDHKRVDDQPNYYTVDKLHEIKAEHERQVRSLWTEDDERREQDDGIYAAYVDIWAGKTHIEQWEQIRFGFVQADTPSIQKSIYDDWLSLIDWTAARIWPGRYPSLEKAIQNHAAVTSDLQSTLSQHLEFERDPNAALRTIRYYKVPEGNREMYELYAQDFREHCSLVYALFCELTRSANYVLDFVRQDLLRTYRLLQGVLLTERADVPDAKAIRERSEYQPDRRVDFPYPGLEKFKKLTRRRQGSRNG